jgi:hypothetical protein
MSSQKPAAKLLISVPVPLGDQSQVTSVHLHPYHLREDGGGESWEDTQLSNEAMITPVRPCSSEIWLRRQKGTKSSLPVYVTAQGQEVASRSQPPQEWEELPSLYLEEWSACSQLQDGSQPQDCGLNVVCPLQNSC